jgi:hypothetical protein
MSARPNGNFPFHIFTSFLLSITVCFSFSAASRIAETLSIELLTISSFVLYGMVPSDRCQGELFIATTYLNGLTDVIIDDS